MIVRELLQVLTGMNPSGEAQVVLFTEKGRREPLDILAVTQNNGDTR